MSEENKQLLFEAGLMWAFILVASVALHIGFKTYCPELFQRHSEGTETHLEKGFCHIL